MAHLLDHFVEGGSFRQLIYQRLGCRMKDYGTLYSSGAFCLSQVFFDLREIEEVQRYIKEHFVF